jgi:FKBP-type peptidyl-prolyl cis-trans isomerase SlyD
VLDGNHPLAGIALRAALRIVEVREATDDEIEARSVGNVPLLQVAPGPGRGSSLH